MRYDIKRSISLYSYQDEYYDGKLDPQLETWLLAIGKKEEIEKWRESINE